MNPLQLHLLLADDDEDDRAFFQDALKKIAVSVELTTVEDGEELMQWLTQKKQTLPDLLFLDLNMPRKNGLQCLLQIKQHPDLQSLPVIILSTTSNPEEVEKLYKNGAQYYIQKPGSFKQLTQILEKVIRLPEEKKRSVQPARENFIIRLY